MDEKNERKARQRLNDGDKEQAPVESLTRCTWKRTERGWVFTWPEHV